MTEFRRSLLRNLISPTGLALFSYALFLSIWALPPLIYTAYIGEPDLIFLEPRSLLLVTLCVLAFILGAHAAGRNTTLITKTALPRLRASSPLRVLLAPILLFTVYCLFAIHALNSTFNVFDLLFSQQGNDIKQIIGAQGLGQRFWDYSINLLIATLWWASIRITQFDLGRLKKTIFWLAYCFAIIVGVTMAAARADRTILTAFLVGTWITYLYRKVYVEETTIPRAAVAAIALTVAVLGSFLTLAFFRGAVTTHLLVLALLSYTIAPYNRLAALLLGIMHYTYQGTGVYLVRYISQMNNNSLLAWIPTALAMPDSFTVWRSEFISVSSAGLIGGLNWSSTFGYVFSDLGWWSPLYFLILGVLCGWTWSRFLQNKLFALIAYPWFGFWIVFWIGWNCIFDYEFVGLMEGAVVLWFYEKALVRRIPVTEESTRPQLPSPSQASFTG